MNKKMILIIAIVLVVLGGALGFWYKTKDAEKEISQLEKNVPVGEKWNPYTAEAHHHVTLSDQLISAGGGDYVIKMSLTLDFTNDEAYYKFKGYKDIKEAEKAEGDAGGHGSEEGHVTPMELKINDTIGELAMKANDEQLTDREILKSYLKDGINKKLGFEEPIIKEIYIENFIIQ